MQNNVFGMIFLLYFFKTENTPSKNEVLYKIKFIVKKIRFEKKKKRFQNRMSNRHKSICLFTSRENTCFSCKPKILVPNYLGKKKGKTFTKDTFYVWFPCLYCLMLWNTTFLGVQLYM